MKLADPCDGGIRRDPDTSGTPKDGLGDLDGTRDIREIGRDSIPCEGERTDTSRLGGKLEGTDTRPVYCIVVGGLDIGRAGTLPANTPPCPIIGKGGGSSRGGNPA